MTTIAGYVVIMFALMIGPTKLKIGGTKEIDKADMDFIFQQEESEDERIRKDLIYDIERLPMQGVLTHRSTSEYIAYLEKQKEQKPAEVEQNPLVRMLKDKKAITEDIRNGIPTKTIEKERNVKFATPVDVSHTEWSEEDKKNLKRAIQQMDLLEEYIDDSPFATEVAKQSSLEVCRSVRNWLKSFRPS